MFYKHSVREYTLLAFAELLRNAIKKLHPSSG
jgi:hypothetical protein